jgi:hypothetical protein
MPWPALCALVVSWAVRRSSGSNATASCIVPPHPESRSSAVRPANMVRSWRRMRPETHGPADAQWEGIDEQGKRVVGTCWKGLHFREAPLAEVCVLRVQREAARGSKRDPRESWFIWIGEEDVPLEQVRPWYRKRFSRGAWLSLSQARLALGTRASAHGTAAWNAGVGWWRAPAINCCWLNHSAWLSTIPGKANSAQSPLGRFVASCPAFCEPLGTPARPSKPRGKSPGWRKGRQRTPAPRFAVVRKPKKVPKTQRKAG